MLCPMFNLDILEIVIGLAFIYMSFSMLVTLLNEYVTALLKLRGKTLFQAIVKMLGSELGEAFYKHHLIESISRKGRKPSYIEAGTFAKVVMDLMAQKANSASLNNPGAEKILKNDIKALLAGAGTSDAGVWHLLQSFAEEVNYDTNKFAVKLEAWFESMMDRTKDWYISKIRIITLIVSFLVAVLLNVDTIKAYKALSANADLRTELVGMASDYLESNPEGAAAQNDSSVTAIRKSLDSLYLQEIVPQSNMLGFGWKVESYIKDGEEKWELKGFSMTSVFGWLLTAFAISLGAPFWFDILNKVMQLRSALRPEPTDKNENSSRMPPGMPPSDISFVSPDSPKSDIPKTDTQP